MTSKLILSLLMLTSLMTVKAQQQTAVYFDFDRSELNPAAINTLDSLLATRDGIRSISLQGHCDAIGPDDYNMALSIKRVNTVRNYLGNKSGNLEITVKGFGERSPAADNNSPENRQLNRRVELLVYRNDEGSGEKTLTEKLLDTTITVGSQVVLPMINFVGGRHQFLEESIPMLEQLLNAMRSFPSLEVEIQGHICCQPDEREGLDNETGLYNLSHARAREVYKFLVDNGIDKNRLSYRGFGHSKPLYPYPERTEEEMTANRRVEIKIIKK